MRKEVVSRALCVGLLLLLPFAVFAGGAREPTPETFELTAYTILDQRSVLTQAQIRWAELVEERTGGAVSIDVFHSGELGGDVETVEEMRQGLIDIRTAGGGLHAHYYPEMQMTELPFLFRNKEHLQEVLYGPLGEQLYQGFEQHGVKALTMFDIGFRGISNTVRPVRSIEDVEGLRIRVPETDIYILTWEKFGAQPIGMAWPDVYTSLQTGVLDAQDNAPEHTLSNNTYEVQDYYTWLQYIWMGAVLTLNLDTWNSLPPEYQDVMIEAGQEVSEWTFDQLYPAQEEALDEMERRGLQITRDVDMSGFRRAAEELYEEELGRLDWFDAEWVQAVMELGERF